jgi:hypothetical protein
LKRTTNNGKKGGMLKGKLHRDGGIKAIVTDADVPVELEGGEVIITRPAVADPTVRTLKGTNKEILSEVNQSGGGVPIYEKGGEVLLAPNGEPSNLDAEQYRFVRSPEFKEWFGDWEDDPDEASRMTDENGEPKIFYHGSESDFQKFDKKKIGSATDPGWLGAGFYFYGVLDQAQQYGKVRDYFLNIRNPYYATRDENEFLGEKNSPKESRKFTNAVREKGYDGVYYNGDLREETVVFEPDQIMSADPEQLGKGGKIESDGGYFKNHLLQIIFGV